MNHTGPQWENDAPPLNLPDTGDIDVDKAFAGEAANNPFSTSVQLTNPLQKRKQEKKLEASRDYQRQFLRQVEQRSASANSRINTTKQALEETLSYPSNAKTTADMLLQSKERARANFFEHIKALNMEDFKTKCQTETAGIVREYETKVADVLRERDRYMWESQKNEEELEKIKSEFDSQKHVIDLLRKKLQKMTDREVEMERKLKVFSKMEPIFLKLSEQFDFQGPAEVIDRLETLERGQIDSYTQLLEAEEDKNRMERELEGMKKTMENERQQTKLEIKQATQKIEIRNRELKEQLDDTTRLLNRAEEVQDRYLNLNFAVVDLWTTWEKSELVKLSDFEKPDMSNPLQIVSAMHYLFTLHAPTRSSVRLRELSGLANTLWLKYFRDEPDLKSKPRQIFKQVSIELDESRLLIERLDKQFSDVSLRSKESGADAARLEREKRVLIGELERRQVVARSALSGGTGMVSTGGSPVTVQESFDISRGGEASTKRDLTTNSSFADYQSLSPPVSETGTRPKSSLGRSQRTTLEASKIMQKQQAIQSENSIKAKARRPVTVQAPASSFMPRPATAGTRRAPAVPRSSTAFGNYAGGSRKSNLLIT
jgi:hypothetical protein